MAYSRATQRAKASYAERLNVPMRIERHKVIAATMSFLRLSCGTPGRLWLLQRALCRWQTGLGAFDARELKKEMAMAGDRVRNLKKGWKDERDQRVELERRLAEAEAEASGTLRALREAQAQHSQQQLMMIEHQQADGTCTSQGEAAEELSTALATIPHPGRAQHHTAASSLPRAHGATRGTAPRLHRCCRRRRLPPA